jgi:hypothetical protein
VSNFVSALTYIMQIVTGQMWMKTVAGLCLTVFSIWR